MANKNVPADRWHSLANAQLFMDYVRERLGRDPRAWGDFPPAWHRDRPTYPQEHSTRIAVARKNQFAVQMAELPELPDPADIRDRWAAAMREAEREIAAYLATSPEAGQLALA